MKGLVFSYFFPPLNSSEGNVTFKLINASKYSYDVFFQNVSEKWSYGKNNSLQGKNIHLLPSNSPNTKLYRKKGKKYFTKEVMADYDFMMSRSMPPESHEIALSIKKRMPDKYWLASFGDPLDRNPYDIYRRNDGRYASLRSIGGLLKRIKVPLKKIWNFSKDRKNKVLQKRIFAYADTLIFNSELQCRYMLGDVYDKYESKVLIIPHSYDTSLYTSHYDEVVLGKNDVLEDNNKINILFAGHSDALRSLKTFLEALASGKEYFESKLQFTILGNLPKEDQQYIKDAEIGSFVTYGEQVGYEESLACMKKADLLLHVDALFPANIMKENIFFAAKIADYLGSGTKILGLTTEGISQNILIETHNYCLPNNRVLISNFLYDVLRGAISIEREEKLPLDYDVKKIVEAFDKRVELSVR